MVQALWGPLTVAGLHACKSQDDWSWVPAILQMQDVWCRLILWSSQYNAIDSTMHLVFVEVCACVVSTLVLSAAFLCIHEQLTSPCPTLLTCTIACCCPELPSPAPLAATAACCCPWPLGPAPLTTTAACRCPWPLGPAPLTATAACCRCAAPGAPTIAVGRIFLNTVCRPSDRGVTFHFPCSFSATTIRTCTAATKHTSTRSMQMPTQHLLPHMI
jgi:hypothetical protein